MADHRHVGFSGDVRRTLSAEDGVAYRGFHQEHEAIKRHVEYLDHKVNEAPSAGNTQNWQYGGSIPMVLLMDWLQERGARMDQWARDEGGIKKQFIKWLASEHPKLLPKRGPTGFTVPHNYVARKNAEAEIE